MVSSSTINAVQSGQSGIPLTICSAFNQARQSDAAHACSRRYTPTRFIVKFLIIAISISFSLSVAAQDQQTINLDCKDAKEASVTEIPEIFKGLAAVHCTIYGHLITGAEGVLWNYPGGFAPVIIPAQMVKAEPKAVNHDMYFTSVSANTLKGEDAKKIFSKFGKGFDMSEVSAPEEVLELIATNNSSITQKVYIFDAGPKSKWGFA